MGQDLIYYSNIILQNQHLGYKDTPLAYKMEYFSILKAFFGYFRNFSGMVQENPLASTGQDMLKWYDFQEKERFYEM